MNELSLVFNGPAGAWNEALPLGNGSMERCHMDGFGRKRSS